MPSKAEREGEGTSHFDSSKSQLEPASSFPLSNGGERRVYDRNFGDSFFLPAYLRALSRADLSLGVDEEFLKAGKIRRERRRSTQSILGLSRCQAGQCERTSELASVRACGEMAGGRNEIHELLTLLARFPSPSLPLASGESLLRQRGERASDKRTALLFRQVLESESSFHLRCVEKCP